MIILTRAGGRCDSSLYNVSLSYAIPPCNVYTTARYSTCFVSLGFSFDRTHVTSFFCVDLGNAGCIVLSRFKKSEKSAMILNLW